MVQEDLEGGSYLAGSIYIYMVRNGSNGGGDVNVPSD